jgi:hypothetical protein
MQTETKEVYFYMYCNICEFETVSETEDPCNECLTNPTNIDSRKPVKFEPK